MLIVLSTESDWHSEETVTPMPK